MGNEQKAISVSLEDKGLREGKRMISYGFVAPAEYYSDLVGAWQDPFLRDTEPGLDLAITMVASTLDGYERALGISPIEYNLVTKGLDEETIRACIDEKLERYRKK